MPSWRATKDVSIKDDLVEEVGRMIGYSSITPVSPLLPAAVPVEGRAPLLHELRKLVAAQGFTRSTTIRSSAKRRCGSSASIRRIT